MSSTDVLLAFDIVIDNFEKTMALLHDHFGDSSERGVAKGCEWSVNELRDQGEKLQTFPHSTRIHSNHRVLCTTFFVPFHGHLHS